MSPCGALVDVESGFAHQLCPPGGGCLWCDAYHLGRRSALSHPCSVSEAQGRPSSIQEPSLSPTPTPGAFYSTVSLVAVVTDSLTRRIGHLEARVRSLERRDRSGRRPEGGNRDDDPARGVAFDDSGQAGQ